MTDEELDDTCHSQWPPERFKKTPVKLLQTKPGDFSDPLTDTSAMYRNIVRYTLRGLEENRFLHNDKALEKHLNLEFF